MLEAAAAEPDVQIAERRASARHIAVMLIAKLSRADTQTICRIRNISSMGARIETNLTLQKGQCLALELRSDLKMTGRVMWSNGGQAGVQFDDAIDVARYLMRSESRIDRRKPRPPRYECAANVVLVTDGGCFSCSMFDIGLSGAGLSDLPARTKLRTGHVVKLIADGISSHHATVAWAEGNRAGIKFRHPLKYTELQEWLPDYARPTEHNGATQPFQAPVSGAHYHAH